MEEPDGKMHPLKATAIVLGASIALWVFVGLALSLGGVK